MTQSLLGRLRRFWLDVHLWIGVGLFVVLVPLGLSGSFLVWDRPIDRAVLHPHRYAVTGEARLPASAYLEAARAAFGDKAVPQQVRFPESKADPIIVTGRIAGPPAGGRPRTLTAWVDPGTAKVLDTAETRNEFIGVMHNLHGNLMVPGIGRKIVGWLGWAMFVSSVTGLWLWWPRNGAVLKALRWRRSPSTLFNLHHMVGFWICVPLAVLSLTGVYISFPKTSHALFGVPPPAGPPGAEAPKGGEGKAGEMRREGGPRDGEGKGGEGKGGDAKGGERKGGGEGRAPGGPGGGQAAPLAKTDLSIDAAIAAARAEAPGAEPTQVTLPTAGRNPSWRIQMKTPGQEQAAAIRVGDRTGEAGPARGPQQGQQDPLSRWMREVHDGTDTGIVWQTIIFVGGVAPFLLGVSGTIMWLRRRERRRHLKHSPA